MDREDFTTVMAFPLPTVTAFKFHFRRRKREKEKKEKKPSRTIIWGTKSCDLSLMAPSLVS